MEQVGGLDAAFLYCETPTMHMQVCGLLLLDPSTMPSGYSYDRIRSMVFERLSEIPSVRQKLAKVPFNLGRPFWVDDPDLDIDRHLHRVVLEPPGDERSLANVVGDIASWQLRRDRPLWELWVIEGLADGRVAILVKMHHSTIDGVSGASMMGQMLDLEPVPPTPTLSSDERPAQQPPSPLELLARTMTARLAEPLELARLVPATAFRLATTLWRLGRQGDTGTPMTKPFTAPRTLFNATITARRSVAVTEVALADIKTVKDARRRGWGTSSLPRRPWRTPRSFTPGRGTRVRPRSDGRSGGYDQGIGDVLDPGHRRKGPRRAAPRHRRCQFPGQGDPSDGRR